MPKIRFVYDCQSDLGTLAGGSWFPELPLSNLQTRRLHQVARSTDALPASTKIEVNLVAPLNMKGFALGPSNLSSGFSRRVTAYSDSARTDLIYDSGWTPGATPAPWNTLNWVDAAFWNGLPSLGDRERGVYLIFVPEQDVFAQYWTIEVDDNTNPDGYLTFGRLFMGRTWEPSLNYDYSNNGLSFEDNTLRSTTQSGGEISKRRTNPRIFQCAFNLLGETELYSEGYRFQRVVGYDDQILILPDPFDTQFIYRRSFLARARRMDALSQVVYNHGSTAFEFKEVLI